MHSFLPQKSGRNLMFTAIFRRAVYGGNFPTNDVILASAYLGGFPFSNLCTHFDEIAKEFTSIA